MLKNNRFYFSLLFAGMIFYSAAALAITQNKTPAKETLLDSTKSYENKSGGKAIDSYSTQYTNDAKLIEKGGCQLIAYPGAPFKVREKTPNSGQYELLPKGASGYGVLEVNVEKITDPTHPFAPRNEPEWQELKAQDTTQKCPMISGKKFTKLCGTETLDEIGGLHAWDNPSGPVKLFTAQGFGSPKSNFEYYSIPMSSQKNGKILTTPARQSGFHTSLSMDYWICYEELSSTGYGVVLAEAMCCDVAQYLACRDNILPPVEPKNKLKTSYGMHTPSKSVSPNNTNKTDYSKNTNANLPRIYDSERNSQQDLYNNGLGFATSLPADKFGYNMPVMKHWPTGDAGSTELVNNFTNRKIWEPWRDSIAGVNSYFAPDESNASASGVFNKSGQIGGWNELVLYQARCQHLFGLNCICDYFKNFYSGSAIGNALSRFDSSVSLNNSPQIEKESVTYEGKTYERKVDKSERVLSKYEASFLRGGKAFPGLLGHNIKNSTWPGDGAWLIKGGLSQAKKGDIIIYDEEGTGTEKGRFHAAFVEDSPKNRGGQTCLQVSESDNGTLLDSAGNTENWGKKSLWFLCNGANNVSNTQESGSNQLKGCNYGDYQYCYEKNWNKWKIYRPYDFTDPSNPRLIDNRKHEVRIDKPQNTPTVTTTTGKSAAGKI